MKKIYLILLVIALFGGLGAVAFFVTKKKKDSKKSSSKAPVITPEEKVVIVPPKTEVAPSIPEKPLVKQSLEMDIKVPYVDVVNRSFDYSMHYKGIPYKGTFKDGITSTVHLKKSFGSFLIKQRMNRERGSFDVVPIALKSKAISSSTKGGAVKAGVTGKVLSVGRTDTGISSIVSLNSDWVDLFIADTQDKVLKQLSVNLRTGETTDANIKF